MAEAGGAVASGATSSGDGAGKLRITLLALYHAVLAVLIVYLLVVLWPDIEKSAAGVITWKRAAVVFGQNLSLTDDVRLILIVVCMGALGSYVHAATSFVSYVGNRSLVFSWASWYLLRPFIGLALALIFYFAIRGGLLTAGSEAKEISLFGVASVAGLVGMFSKQATDKLREAFDTLFKTEQGKGDDARSDKLDANQSVSKLMLERGRITGIEIPEGKTAADVLLTQMHEIIKGVVTRVPVFERTGAIKCIVHQSLLYKFIADNTVKSYGSSPPTFDVQKATLAQFLAAPGMKELVQDSIAFVAENATLMEARTVMLRNPKCQDVFVTEHGRSDEPVKGWITNAQLASLR